MTRTLKGGLAPGAETHGDGEEGETPARRGIQSAGIGFRVLAALAAEAGPATLSAVARRAELSPSQAHRYLASLVQCGMARQNGASGLYDLGPQAIQIGLAALSRTDAFALADPAVANFTHETGRTALIAVRGPLGATVVRWHAGRVPVITSLSVGSVLPFLRSATGRVFLAFLGEDEVAAAAARELAADQSAKPINLVRSRAEVRAEMSATVDEMLIPGLRATAVPVLDIQGRPALVVTAMATSAFDRRGDAAVIERLRAVGRRLTEEIGGIWPHGAPVASSLEGQADRSSRRK
ncbi:MAG: IclR family transcriptional regulator [Hyphomicrobiaceae bacterium]|nr:MAG: IclR family transcriptional regulator [Hyphomicrobiaceae bacterium]